LLCKPQFEGLDTLSMFVGAKMSWYPHTGTPSFLSQRCNR